MQDALNINKINFEPYGDFFDQVFLQFNENLMKIKKPNDPN